jgi:hypothetical protein
MLTEGRAREIFMNMYESLEEKIDGRRRPEDIELV